MEGLEAWLVGLEAWWIPIYPHESRFHIPKPFPPSRGGVPEICHAKIPPLLETRENRDNEALKQKKSAEKPMIAIMASRPFASSAESFFLRAWLGLLNRHGLRSAVCDRFAFVSFGWLLVAASWVICGLSWVASCCIYFAWMMVCGSFLGQVNKAVLLLLRSYGRPSKLADKRLLSVFIEGTSINLWKKRKEDMSTTSHLRYTLCFPVSAASQHLPPRPQF